MKTVNVIKTGRRLLALVLSSALASACQYDMSWKQVTFQNVEYQEVFSVCHTELRKQFMGMIIRADETTGHLETDPVEFNVGNTTHREQAYVYVEEHDPDRVTVGVLAPIAKMEVYPSRKNPVVWEVLGSDVPQERTLLDSIIGEVLRLDADALVVEKNVAE